MVWPIIAAGVGSAALNYYGNEQARRASRDAMGKAADQRALAEEYIRSWDPSFLADNLSYDYLGDLQNVAPDMQYYDPQSYASTEMGAPSQFQAMADPESTMVGDSDQMRAIQLEALMGLSQRADEGLTAQDQADFMRGQRRAGEMARGREGAIMENMRARGMSGSGLEAALRMQASQGGAGRLAQQEADRAAANAQVRMGATQATMGGAGQMRGADVALNATNAGILNQFALDNSRRRQEIQNMNVDLENKKLWDEWNRQNQIDQMNVQGANQAQMTNQQRQMQTDLQRNQSANQILQAQGQGKNAYTQTINDAYDQYYGKLAGSALGGIPDIYATGAADADYQRGKYGALGDVVSAVGQGYAAQPAAAPAPQPGAGYAPPPPAASPYGYQRTAQSGSYDPANAPNVVGTSTEEWWRK